MDKEQGGVNNGKICVDENSLLSGEWCESSAYPQWHDRGRKEKGLLVLLK